MFFCLLFRWEPRDRVSPFNSGTFGFFFLRSGNPSCRDFDLSPPLGDGKPLRLTVLDGCGRDLCDFFEKDGRERVLFLMKFGLDRVKVFHCVFGKELEMCW